MKKWIEGYVNFETYFNNDTNVLLLVKDIYKVF